jgi:hypothetical protein
LLLKILEALHARPVVAKLVVLQLSSNPLLDPLLAERLLLALAALDVTGSLASIAAPLQRALSRLTV